MQEIAPRACRLEPVGYIDSCRIEGFISHRHKMKTFKKFNSKNIAIFEDSLNLGK